MNNLRTYVYFFIDREHIFCYNIENEQMFRREGEQREKEIQNYIQVQIYHFYIDSDPLSIYADRYIDRFQYRQQLIL